MSRRSQVAGDYDASGSAGLGDDGPLVSVVIPVHNQEAFVSGAVTSALRQAGVAVEVIVVDDASTDRTPEVLAQFGSAIRVARNETSLERSAARNHGARLARGEVLAFLDADDEWRPQKIAAQLPYAMRGQSSVTGVEIIDGEGIPVDRYVPPARVERAQIVTYNPLFGGPSSLVIPKDTFDELGGFPEARDVQGSEDWLFFARLILAGGRVAVVPELLTRYRVHGEQSTSDPRAMARSMWAATDVLEQERLSPRERGRLRAMTAIAIARAFAASRDWSEARRWAVTAVRAGSLPAAAGSAARMTASSLSRAARRRARRLGLDLHRR